MARPTVQQGSKGEAVKVAQQALIARSYLVGPAGADGIFGIHTFRAVLNYQSDRSAGEFWALEHPLTVDGICGPQTWERLDPDTIREGSTGTGVRLLQNILKNSGLSDWDPGSVDGVFGPRTRHAVTSYQADLDLTADGIVGPVTWTALWS